MLVRSSIALGLVVLSLSACGSSLHDVEVAHAHAEGTTRLYEVSAPRALAIAKDVLKRNGAATVTPGESPNELLATIDASIAPYRMPTNCGVWVVAQDEGHSRVTIVSRRSGTTWAIGLTEGTFHDDFAKAVAVQSAAGAAPPPTSP